MPASDLLTSVRTLARAGLLRPSDPRKLLGAGLALRHFGVNFAGAFAAAGARNPDRQAVVDESGSLTWGELDRRSNAIANNLASRGVREGDVVAMLCRNHRGFVEATAALAKLGAHVLYLNTGFAGPQLREVLAREKPVALIHDQDFTDLLQVGSSIDLTVLSWADDSDGMATLDSLVATAPDDVPPAPSRAGRTIILTSGTTGTPKGAPRDQVSGVGPAVAMLDRIPYRDGDVAVVPAPLFHSWGFANMSLSLLLNFTIVLRRRFDPEKVLADVERHEARVLVAVPVMLQRILELPAEVRRRYDTSSLEVVPLSGSALPGLLAERWMAEFGDNLYNLYGSTEVGWATIATPADLRADPRTAGRPPMHTVVKLLDDTGREVAEGATGRIFVGSELTFDGYTGGGNKEVIDGLMSTGDTGHFDADGRLYVDGRDDEMIVSGGENVFPREVEDLLASQPEIVEAAVVGIEDPEFGQRLKAFVVLHEGAAFTADDVRTVVKQNLANFKVPRDVEFLAELPRNATGKVLKRDLL